MAATAHVYTATTTKAEFRDLGNYVPTGTLPAAPASLSATPVNSGRIDLSWAASSGATSYRVERKGPGQTSFTQLAANITGTGYQDYAVTAASTYVYRVQAVNASGGSGYSPTDDATTPPATTPALVGQDIGAPRPAGSTTEITPGRDYDIVAGGTDIAGLADHFHFASRQVTGDFDVKVRVASLDQRDVFTKAGLMVREDLTAGSRNAMLSTTFSDKGYRFTWRQVTNDLTQAAGSGPVSFPNGWVRLQRVGDRISGYRSTDGQTWTLVSSATITGLAQTVYVGLAATSHNETMTTTAQFRDFGNV
jgi:regulation of enolase protein 1 (concanavalin A-like superfamily)